MPEGSGTKTLRRHLCSSERRRKKLPHLDSNQEPADSLSSLFRGVFARLARAWRGRAGERRGAAPGPVAPVIDLLTRERVA